MTDAVHVSMASLALMAFGSAALACAGTYALLAARIAPNDVPETGDSKKSQKRRMAEATPAWTPSPQDSAHAAQTEPKREDPYDPSPRKGYLSWDEYFMSLAFLSAQRSKDPNKQVGAVIVGGNKVVLGIGYNGFPRGCPDESLPWAKLPPKGSNNPLHTKYPYVVHAEANAVLNTNTAAINGATLYVTMFPCNECAKLLIQAGIRQVVYHEEKVGTDNCLAGPVQLNSHSTDTQTVDGSVLVNIVPNGIQGQATAQPPALTNSCPNPSDACQGKHTHAAESSSGSIQVVAGADACYLASRRLLTLAGVLLRQHKLTRTVVLRGPP